MACSDCPELIVATIAARVDSVSYRVMRIRRLTSIFNRFVTEAANAVGAVATRILQELYDLIPEPPVATVDFIVGLLTCPLTPLAFLIDPSLVSIVDPRRLWREYQRTGRVQLDRWNEFFGIALDAIEVLDPRPLRIILEEDFPIYSAPVDEAVHVTDVRDQATADVRRRQRDDNLKRRSERYGRTFPVRLVRRYVREVYRATENPGDFAVQLATAVAAVEYVKVTCPNIYNSTLWPFSRFTDLTRDFSFDGVLPSNLTGSFRDVAYMLARIEAKLYRWQTFLSAPLPE